MALVLLIQMTAIGRADSPPARWEDPDAAQSVNRIVVEGIWRSAADVHGRTHFADQLEVLVDWKVETDASQKLIRPIQQTASSIASLFGLLFRM